ncbi:dipeptide/oligopeptide/nickel ABC transporter permease/ATP-binding protein [Herbiconiux daphne]|uniref:Dipeptide/oligopeptide/nickel ABC transporter permease/ATP-binding protein n=1 Tax=Herbiconiux daphne TaxID=2970914 RepID=A0ABT2H710_9MICO|nr:dipeptide/oligopeptide/nickel ABC transporter permease/ATP-binding protein [Herbiconiux daphne]MCS5735727.1 dipeptide/oligopeptide/nickel ABC transporter permease/ATP-binding protein [Herbiconiux daphne]
MTEATIASPVSLPAPRSRTRIVRRVLRDPVGITALAILIVAISASYLAGFITPIDPNATDLSSVLAGPSGAHPLGTDSAGRDVLARLLWGGQSTFAAAALATVVALAAGVPSGLIAGYYGGWFDAGTSWITNMLMSLPAVVVLLAARAALGPSVWISMALFGVLLGPSFFRLVRTSVISVRGELYVDAARVSGLSDARIISRHVLYVVRAPIVIQAAIIAGIAIGIQAGLEFLGLGDSSAPTWGMMLNEGFRNVLLSPLFLLWPALAITLVTAAFAVLGNSLRDALEDDEITPRTKGRAIKHIPHSEAGLVPTGSVAAADTDHLLVVRDLSVEYPRADGTTKRVVDGVSFHVDRGEVVGIVGESGSGKTQTAFSVLGLLPETASIAEGHIVFDGIELVSRTSGAVSRSRMDPLRGTRIAYVPQEPMSNLDPAFTVGYQLSRPLVKRLGLSRAAAKKRALELLATVGIPDPGRTYAAYPHEISGGMAQRVLIAGAVSCEPDLLIADEPTTALDVTVQAEVLELLRTLQSELRMGVLMVTHNFGVVADLCDRVVVMRDSRIVESGDVVTILSRPSEDYTRTLLASTLEGKTPRTLLLSDSAGETA